MPLPKRFLSSVQHTGWKMRGQSKKNEETGEIESESFVVNVVQIMWHTPGKKDSAHIQSQTGSLPADAPEDYRKAVTAALVQKLDYNFIGEISDDQEPIVTSKRMFVSDDTYPEPTKNKA